MARTNQGIFKKMRKRFDNLQAEYNDLKGQYNGEIGLDFFEGLAQDSGSLYDKLKEFVDNLKGMIDSTKFESNEIKQEFCMMLDDAKNMREELRTYFNRMVKMIEESGGLSDIEIETIEDYSIWKR